MNFAVNHVLSHSLLRILRSFDQIKDQNDVIEIFLVDGIIWMIYAMKAIYCFYVFDNYTCCTDHLLFKSYVLLHLICYLVNIFVTKNVHIKYLFDITLHSVVC